MAIFSHAAKIQMTENILILGGTMEAADLAERLVVDGHTVTTSLAGRTLTPKQLPGKIRAGGFGGAGGLATYLAAEKITILIDATHPFAQQISANAVEAAHHAGVSSYALRRPAWQAQPGDRWQSAETIEAAVDAVPDGATVFLALGSQHIGAFAVRPDCDFITRMVDQPTDPLTFSAKLILGRPSNDPAQEAKIFADNGVNCIVCRNSGGKGGYAKIIAARDLVLPVIMIDRPLHNSIAAFETIDELISALKL